MDQTALENLQTALRDFKQENFDQRLLVNGTLEYYFHDKIEAMERDVKTELNRIKTREKNYEFNF